MACGIGGATLYSWGQIEFLDRQGTRIKPLQRKTRDDLPNMLDKCGALRWIFIDEVEASDAETIGQLEHNIIVGTSRQSPHYYCWHDGRQHLRPFAGANVCFLEHFWQLRPTGQVALMSNPLDRRTDAKPSALEIMGMFWLDMP